jgi:hypothetical protein
MIFISKALKKFISDKKGQLNSDVVLSNNAQKIKRITLSALGNFQGFSTRLFFFFFFLSDESIF